jgi:hypothetical protein
MKNNLSPIAGLSPRFLGGKRIPTICIGLAINFCLDNKRVEE